ncbi:MAG TPA: cell division protein FtsQ [Glaciihabitans sp.]|nr:cell division protein FtsQ [Glaciihabitans sp.]
MTSSPTTSTSTPARRGLPRPGDLSQAQKLMVFVLSMTMFGLANILTEVLPELRVGPVELSISYLAFVPVVIVCLFHPLYGALGAPLGEIVFVDLLMGNFSGIGELEGYIQLALGLYVAGSLVRDPRSRKQVAIAAMVAVLLDKLIGGIVDIGKVWVGVADAEFVEGLPQSILLIEGIAFSTDFIISGILFGAIPAMLLAPRLYGKIEPLLGMEPRNPKVPVSRRAQVSAPFVIGAVFLSFVAMIAAFLDELDVKFGVWEPDFIDQYGSQFLWLGVSAAVIVLVAAIVIVRWAMRRRGVNRAAFAERTNVRS